ncbi:MAG TPA: hypothetical protein VG348_15900 [Acidimicrobiia bacterium]|jgi:hypothetical protein|nr:hypothetical protein [Acidimicrobiia bacterium]
MRLGREFLVLSLGTVFFLLALDHYTGATKILDSFGSLAIGTYGTLQGRNVAFPGGVQVWGGSQ